jgi:hypothetical protein
VLCTKTGFRLPGIPTIPEQIREDRTTYIEALEAADIAFVQLNKVDVSKLEKMLTQMLTNQLLGVPSIRVRSRLLPILDARIFTAPKKILSERYSTDAIAHELWSLSDHVVLQIGSPSEIKAAEKRQTLFGNPFPGLLLQTKRDGAAHLRLKASGSILSAPRFDVDFEYALDLEEDVSCALIAPRLKRNKLLSKSNWSLNGVLYIVRYGPFTTPNSADQAFDALIAKHLATDS